MISIKKDGERGYSKHDWLESRFSFSFAEYYDEDNIHFGPLRVLNEDYIAASSGFPEHPHRDMEIITYIMEGEIAHQDSMGNREVIRKNEVQKMSAGRGIFHSEMNPRSDSRAHLFQTWIIPNKRGLSPYYEMKRFTEEDKLNKLYLIGSPDGRNDSVFISQDAFMYLSKLEQGSELTHHIQPGRGLYIQVAKGSISVNGSKAGQGDAVMLEAEVSVVIAALSDAEIILFDVKMDFTD